MYCNVLKLQSLYLSTVFKNGTDCDHVAAHINTLFRIRKIFQLNNFRIVQSGDVTSHYKQEVFEMKEENKFRNYLGGSSWPTEWR